MSAQEPTQPPRVAPEGLSSVKLSSTAKAGVIQVEVKIYAQSNDELAVQRAQAEAERIFDEQCRKYGIALPTAAAA